MNVIPFRYSRLILFIAIFFLSFLMRFVAITNLPVVFQEPKRDAFEYDRLAISLLTKGSYVDTEGFPTARRAPLYPLFLAGVYSIFGHSYFWARVIQTILYSFLCIIVFLIGEKLFNKKVALLSSLICVFYPNFIFFSYYGGPGFLLSENLFIFLFSLSVLYFVKLYRRPTIFNAALAGSFLGLANLTRAVTSLFIFFILPWFLVCFALKIKEKFKLWFIIIFSFLTIISPWAFRNYLVFHKIVFTTQAGGLFLTGNNPLAKGGAGRGIFTIEEYKSKLSGKNEIELEKIYFHDGLQYLLSNPKIILPLFIKKLLVFWYFKGDGLTNFWYLFLLPFSLFGIFKSLKLESFRKGAFFLLNIFLYFSFISMIFFGEPRFRYPIEPYMIIFASLGILSIRIPKIKFE